MSEKQLPDFSAFLEAPSKDAVLDLTSAIDQYLEAVEKAAAAEADFNEKKRAVVRYQEHLIPEAMHAAGMQEFTTSAGYKVKIKSDVRASIPVARQPEAFAWLEKNGHGGLIKRTVEVSFAMGQEEDAKKLEEELRNRELSVGSDRRVESSSLKALIRRLLEDKKTQIPMDLLGASEYDKAEVASPKQKNN